MLDVNEEMVGATSDSLTDTERERLAKLEAQIDKGAKAFIAVGKAMREIRDTRLYRATHDTFEEYISKRFGFVRGHAYNLIASADAADNLAETNVPPANEYQVRPLIKLSEENQVKAWEMATEAAGNGKVTHDLVKDAVEEIEGKTEPEQFAITDDLATDYWCGNLAENIAKIEPASVDLLLITNLAGETPTEAAEALDSILTAVEPTTNEDSQTLVICPSLDYHQLFGVAESHGYECGVPFFRDRAKAKKVIDFSFPNAAEVILHFRKGTAELYDPVSNMVCVEDESPIIHSTQKPVALLDELITAAVPPGAMVLDPTAGVGSTVIACRRSDRACIAIETDPKVHKLGLRRLAAELPPSEERADHV